MKETSVCAHRATQESSYTKVLSASVRVGGGKTGTGKGTKILTYFLYFCI